MRYVLHKNERELTDDDGVDYDLPHIVASNQIHSSTAHTFVRLLYLLAQIELFAREI